MLWPVTDLRPGLDCAVLRTVLRWLLGVYVTAEGRSFAISVDFFLFLLVLFYVILIIKRIFLLILFSSLETLVAIFSVAGVIAFRSIPQICSGQSFPCGLQHNNGLKVTFITLLHLYVTL